MREAFFEIKYFIFKAIQIDRHKTLQLERFIYISIFFFKVIQLDRHITSQKKRFKYMHCQYRPLKIKVASGECPGKVGLKIGQWSSLFRAI